MPAHCPAPATPGSAAPTLLALVLASSLACRPPASGSPGETGGPAPGDTAPGIDTGSGAGSGRDTGGGSGSGGGTGGDPGEDAPLNWMNPHGSDASLMWERLDDWSETRARTDVVSFYVQAVGDDHRGHTTAAVQALTGLGIELAVEAGGTLASVGCGDDVGSRSAELELSRLETITAAGGRLSWLSMDGPISRTIATGRAANCGFTLEQSVDALAEYVEIIRDAHPGVQIGWLVNLPNWSYGGIESYQCATKDYGDLQRALDAVVDGLAARGQSLDYLMVDEPYDYSQGLVDSNCHADPTAVDWMGRLRALEDQVRGHGLRFAQIYNSSRGGATSNALFHDDTVAQAGAHRVAGGRPDIRLVSSWYSHPDVVMPETTPYTFTHTALETWRAADGADRR